MLKNRFFRFLIAILIFGVVFGVLFAIETTQNMPSGLWLSACTTFAVCIVGQLLGDIMNVDIVLNNDFFTFIKRVLFFGTTVLAMAYYAFTIEIPESFGFLDWAFLSAGILGPAFAFMVYMFAYIGYVPKKWYPFFFLFSYAAAIIVSLVGGWFMLAEISAIILLAALVIPVIVCFKTGEWPFDECNYTPESSEQIAAKLSYLNDPHLRPGDDRDYDRNGNYNSARCENCAYCKKIYDKYGCAQYYCNRDHSSHSDYDCCSDYKRR